MTEATQSKSRAIVAWQDFQTEIKQREREIASMLPSHISKDKFINSAIAAVKQMPGLLNATPRSLFAAVTKSAQDGLLPDGREGVITVYRTKEGDAWVDTAGWNPMVFGLRKRARELDDIIVSAQVVHENDEFSWDEGDDPHIKHQPAPLGTSRGAMIGTYAIFKNGDGILHREVMDAEQVEAVRGQSKQPDGIMWTKFTAEAWRKTVVRRGFKSIPCSEHLQDIVRRDDEMFAFDTEAPAQTEGRPKAEVVQPPADGEQKALPPVAGARVFGLIDQFGEEVYQTENVDDYAERLSELLEKMANLAEIEQLWDNNKEQVKSLPDSRAADVTALYEGKSAELAGELPQTALEAG